MSSNESHSLGLNAGVSRFKRQKRGLVLITGILLLFASLIADPVREGHPTHPPASATTNTILTYPAPPRPLPGRRPCRRIMSSICCLLCLSLSTIKTLNSSISSSITLLIIAFNASNCSTVNWLLSDMISDYALNEYWD